jgi:hypothetical protein
VSASPTRSAATRPIVTRFDAICSAPKNES